MAWKPDLQNDLRDAICISRTWTLGNLQRRASHTEEAVRFEAQRADLWNHRNAKLPNAQFLLRQSVSQIAPSPSFYAVAKHARNRPAGMKRILLLHRWLEIELGT
jgi:hypothetical protein